MRLPYVSRLLCISLLVPLTVAASVHRDADHHGHGHGHGHECTRRSATVRKEWGSMTKPERREYIDAVHCLKVTPSRFEPGVVPGAKSLYDDFIAVHINKTLSVHTSGIFLIWHREFVSLYEHALQTECHYHGSQPYWDWPLWAHNMTDNPLFDGSDTSLSGDGEYNPSEGPYEIKPGVSLPRGNGGGCVLGGPFVNHTVNFGPFDTALAFQLEMPPHWEAYNPRCLVRDLNTYIASQFCNQQVVDRLLNASNIVEFQGNFTSYPTTLEGFGPHGGGHLSLGDTMADFFASPADPAFYFHHAQVDRMYAIWQDIDPEHRRYALNGTLTFGYKNDTPEATVDTVIDWGVLGKPKTIGELMNPMGGDYCYRYE